LTSRFLSTPEGAAAQRALEDGDETISDLILSTGDRLAAASAILAQEYFKRAAAAWKAFGPAGFARWAALGEDLATVEPSCHDGALAYCATPPQGFGAGGVETAAAWCRLGRELREVSRRLAETFFETTAALVGQPGAIERLQCWAEVASELYRQHGWQGEVLAQAFLSAAPGAVVGLHPAAYRLWAAVGVVLQPVVKERSVFGTLPEDLARWTDRERELFLQTTLAVASVAVKQARVFYDGLPAALGRLTPQERAALLRALAAAGRHIAGSVGDIVPLAGALVCRVPSVDRARALTLLEAVAGKVPAALSAALRSLPRLYEDAGAVQVECWFEAGMRLAADNAQAGIAYFALESRTSLRVLHAGSTAV
jgi:hypothetical protein